MVEPLVGYQRQGYCGVLHHHIGGAWSEVGGKSFAHYGCRAGGYHIGNKLVSIYCHTIDCHKQHTFGGLATIAYHIVNQHITITHHLQRLQAFYYFA